MTVLIVTSPGRSGFGPQFALSYDSGAGNDPFGLGWSLSLPAITRMIDKGLPLYDDSAESDVFILSGAEDLVPEFKKDAAGTWIMKDGKHVVFEEPRTVEGVDYFILSFGAIDHGSKACLPKSSDGRMPRSRKTRPGDRSPKTTSSLWHGWTAESRFSDPADQQRVFSWLICKSYDDKGVTTRLLCFAVLESTCYLTCPGFDWHERMNA